MIILAAACFLGAVVMQAAWIRSAYEGELSMYNKEKEQFQSELQSKLLHSSFLLKSFRELSRTNIEEQKNLRLNYQPLLDSTGVVINQVLQEKNMRVQIANFGLVLHTHDSAKEHQYFPLALHKQKKVENDLLNQSEKICLNCVVGNCGENHTSNYQLMLLYEKNYIYKNIGLLIFGSLLFLVFIGLLFRMLLKKYGQERRLSEAKNDFINNLSHELQTPVFAIQVANKLIKENVVRDHNRIEPFISIIEKEAKQLKQHAQKILELATLENEQVELNLELTDLNKFIEDKKAMLAMMIKNKNGELICKYGKGDLLVEVDRIHLNNVLVTLTENAIKYSHGNARVTVQTSLKDDMVSLQIEDNGIGIKSEYLPYVFEKFYRVPDANKNGANGFGLGLSYVKQIIKLHKGSVSIESDYGTGTKVKILLPQNHQHV
jgi:signal transduction histidine kinase